MKLEIKHLAPYLPYNLKIKLGKHTPIMVCSCGNSFLFKNIDINDVIRSNVSYNAKPILRTLSDLTKEIEHNGERFIPLGKLHYLYVLTPTGRRQKRKYDVISDRGYIGTIPNNDDFKLGIKIHLDNIGRTEHRIIRKLISWHFDVFNLIENNLAVRY